MKTATHISKVVLAQIEREKLQTYDTDETRLGICESLEGFQVSSDSNGLVAIDFLHEMW